MKFNWKILVAVIVLIGSIIWGVNSLRSRFYSGTDLNFSVGGGAVTLTNASESPVSARLISLHTGTFSVASDIEGVSGRSLIQRNGNRSSQLFEFTLPPGESKVTVTRGSDVRFVATSDVSLKAVAQPMSDSNMKTTLFGVVIIVLGALFYLSSTNDHRWMSAARRQKSLDEAAAQETEQKNFNRMYGRDSAD